MESPAAFLILSLKTVWPYLAVLWFLGLFFQILMIANRKPGIRVFDRQLAFNPFNLQFYGDQFLTLKGLMWRNLSWICYGVFSAILIVIIAMYYMKK